MTDYGLLPPEVNSARMYAGAGIGSMMDAAAGWASISATLSGAATAYSSTISSLATVWMGAAAQSMQRAATAQLSWLTATALSAQQTAGQALAAAEAYATAHAATIPPPVVAGNRTLLAALVAGNIVGQNTAVIAATEAQYAEMWAQDAAAMYSYQAQSAAAVQLPTFTIPAPLLGFVQTLIPGFAPGQPLQNLANLLISPIGIALFSSGEFAIDPLSGATAFFALAGLGESTHAEAVANSAMAHASAKAYGDMPGNIPSPLQAQVRVSVGTAQRVGLLRTPPDWARPTPGDFPAPGLVAPATEELPAAIPLPIPLPLGVPRGGTPPRQEKPPPDYGPYSARFIPQTPAGG
jgi:PPE family